MRKLLIITILFFGITSISYSQDNVSDIKRLINIINNDSMIDRMMKTMTSLIKRQAEKQIVGAGAKERLIAYNEFIIVESTEL